MAHMNSSRFPLLKFDSATYFGDISIIFKVQNIFHFKVVDSDSLVYSVEEENITKICENFPDFADVLKIRALRRYRYFKRLAK